MPSLEEEHAAKFTPANSTHAESITAATSHHQHPSERSSIFRQMIRRPVAIGNESSDRHWMNDMAQFDHLRQMATNGQLHAMTVDLFESTGMEAVHGQLARTASETPIVTSYISNVAQHGVRRQRASLGQNNMTYIVDNLKHATGGRDLIVIDDHHVSQPVCRRGTKPMELTF